MNRKLFETGTHHKQKNKFFYVIRNTGTGAYLCDLELKRRVFSSYMAAENELERLQLNRNLYETEVLVSCKNVQS